MLITQIYLILKSGYGESNSACKFPKLMCDQYTIARGLSEEDLNHQSDQPQGPSESFFERRLDQYNTIVRTASTSLFFGRFAMGIEMLDANFHLLTLVGNSMYFSSSASDKLTLILRFYVICHLPSPYHSTSLQPVQ